MKQLLLVMLLIFSLLSCQKNVEPLQTRSMAGASYLNTDISVMREEPGNGGCVTPLTTELVTLPDDSGNDQVKGSLTISNDNDFLYVIVNTLDANTTIGSIQVLYGDAAVMNDMNQYSDDPSVGLNNPQVNVELQTIESTYTIKIPLTSLNTNCLLLNVHASLHTSTTTGRNTEIPVWAKPFNPASQVMKYPWSANVEYCNQFCVLPTCGQLRTQTPGGWGTLPQGANPGSYLYANFSNAFPAGLTVGCSPDFNLQFSSANAISNFLPSGGKAQVLSMSYLNPVGLKNVAAGHLVALTLSVQFDEADVNFAAAGITLGAMVIKTGAFAGWKVADFLSEANQVLGGCSKEHSIQQVLETASKINENYVDGKIDKGYLFCPQ